MSGRCEKCHGTGYLRYAELVPDRQYCDCPMGRDVRLADAQLERKRVEAAQKAAKREALLNAVFPDRKSAGAGDGE